MAEAVGCARERCMLSRTARKVAVISRRNPQTINGGGPGTDRNLPRENGTGALADHAAANTGIDGDRL